MISSRKVDYKDIETALVEVIKRKRDPEDHIRYIAKQCTSNKKTYNERMADFKNWYNKEIYTSLEKLYKLYLEIANQEEKVKNIGATIVHICDINAGGIIGAVTSLPNVPLGLTGAQIIPAQNVAEDWTIAGGHPTNAVPVAPNAEEGNPIVLTGMLEIGALRQNIYESVPSFWAKIQKYGDQLGYTSAQKKSHFLSGAPSQPHYASIAPAIPDVIPQQLAFPMADMQKIIQDAFAKQQAESKAKIKKLKAELQA
ncbi:13323_t:CDS:2 [Cetraspora pellucida]|uniref:13323_t:CDS:1 n=1 Tax=Cetraspora pellucida TaxID=1433469 RepID=A0A9N8VSB0_9GLOM|nr:13323_t:CDS:2 [Cetraspora pellucida]